MTIIRNQVAFRMLAEQIERFPEKYNQVTWSTLTPETIEEMSDDVSFMSDRLAEFVVLPRLSCGSFACLAGNAAALAGWQMLVPADDWESAKAMIRSGDYDDDDVDVGATVVVRDGCTGDIPVVASQVLYGAGSAPEPYWSNRGLEDALLFDGMWRPREGMTVPEALRALADGATLASVTNVDFLNTGYTRAGFARLAEHDIELSRDVPEGMVL